jgi:hypothetical protein
MDWGSAADWISGLATTAAVIFAFFGLRGERTRDRELNSRISTEQAGRDREQAKRAYAEKSAQAAKVSAWHEETPGTDGGVTCIRNGSESVIYDVYAVLVNGRNESNGSLTGPEEFSRMLRVIPPLQTIRFAAPQGWRGMSRTASYDLTFRDSQGVTWFRNNWGHLEERKVDVFAHYGLMHPYPYYEPNPPV